MTSEIANFVIAFAVLLFVFGIVSRKISGTAVTAPMIFVAAGMLLSPEGLDPAGLTPRSSLVLMIAELAPVLTLFPDASKIELQTLLREEKLPGRLLISWNVTYNCLWGYCCCFSFKRYYTCKSGTEPHAYLYDTCGNLPDWHEVEY